MTRTARFALALPLLVAGIWYVAGFRSGETTGRGWRAAVIGERCSILCPGPGVNVSEPSRDSPFLTLTAGHAASCGAERWPVKTLTDAGAGEVDLAWTLATTVERLRELPAPKYGDANPRAAPERTVYSVNARVVAYKLEADRDFHVVIASDSGQTMIVEFPHPECAIGSRVAAQIAAARAAFVARFGKPTAKLKRLKKPVPVTVIGVGFYDKIHGQTGVAPNGIELHPVLALE